MWAMRGGLAGRTSAALPVLPACTHPRARHCGPLLNFHPRRCPSPGASSERSTRWSVRRRDAAPCATCSQSLDLAKEAGPQSHWARRGNPLHPPAWRAENPEGFLTPCSAPTLTMGAIMPRSSPHPLQQSCAHMFACPPGFPSSLTHRPSCTPSLFPVGGVVERASWGLPSRLSARPLQEPLPAGHRPSDTHPWPWGAFTPASDEPFRATLVPVPGSAEAAGAASLGQAQLLFPTAEQG